MIEKLKISEVKTAIFEKLSISLQPYEFKVFKNGPEFKLTKPDLQVEISYAFNNFKPQSIEFYFGCQIIYPNLLKHVQDFYKRHKIMDAPAWNLFIEEGFFKPEIHHLSSKKKSMSYTILKDDSDLEPSIEKSLEIIEKHVLKFIDSISTEILFEKFIEANPKFISEHFNSLSLFSSALIAVSYLNPTALFLFTQKIEELLVSEKNRGLNYVRNFMLLKYFHS